MLDQRVKSEFHIQGPPPKIMAGLNGYLLSGLLIVTLLILALLTSCGSSEEHKKQEQKARHVQEIRNLVAKWNANDKWERQIYGDWPLQMVLTSQLQEILCKEGAPVFILANLEDIVKQANGTYIGYFCRVAKYLERKVSFELELNVNQYQTILSHPLDSVLDYSTQTFALVVKVEDVRSSPNRSPLVVGECLDFVLTGDLNNEDMKSIIYLP